DAPAWAEEADEFLQAQTCAHVSPRAYSTWKFTGTEYRGSGLTKSRDLRRFVGFHAAERRSWLSFDAFSSREPVSTPHQVRGRLRLENAPETKRAGFRRPFVSLAIS